MSVAIAKTILQKRIIGVIWHNQTQKYSGTIQLFNKPVNSIFWVVGWIVLLCFFCTLQPWIDFVKLLNYEWMNAFLKLWCLHTYVELKTSSRVRTKNETTFLKRVCACLFSFFVSPSLIRRRIDRSHYLSFRATQSSHEIGGKSWKTLLQRQISRAEMVSGKKESNHNIRHRSRLLQWRTWNYSTSLYDIDAINVIRDDSRGNRLIEDLLSKLYFWKVPLRDERKKGDSWRIVEDEEMNGPIRREIVVLFRQGTSIVSECDICMFVFTCRAIIARATRGFSIPSL